MNKRWLLGAILVSAFVVGGAMYLGSRPEKQQLVAKPAPIVTPKEPTYEPITQSDVLGHVNAQRAKAGVPTLRMLPELNQSAQEKCNDMINIHYYDHVNPLTGQHGYALIPNYLNSNAIMYASENLNKGLFQNTAQVINNWLYSQPHREAMLDPRYQVTGIAICNDLTDEPHTTTLVEHFVQLRECPVTLCYDGECSDSTGRGTCSYHGGILN